MAIRNYTYTFIFLYVCSIFHSISGDEGCDRSKCKGPLKYYEDLKCTPIYGSEDTCCPVKYNCDHLKEKSKDKCYHKDQVYNIGEKLRAEDKHPCDFECICKNGDNDVAYFSCSVFTDCSLWTPLAGCYLKRSHTECRPGPEICPQEVPDIAKCEVDGKTYFDGQQFTPSSDPTLSCICGAGYTGENVSPFCRSPESYTCDVELRNRTAVYNNCTPVFPSYTNPAIDCHSFSRCQTPEDRIVESENATETGVTPVLDPSFSCIFGELAMKIGDQLKSGTAYESACIKCVCEVPPLPTCQRLPDNECDRYAILGFSVW